MSSREERVAENEASARAINEDLQDAQAKQPDSQYLRILCECGIRDCEEVLAITQAEYEEIRSDPVRFVLTHGHVDPDVDETIASNDRFVVVAKREGVPEQTAVESDPRS